MKISTISWGVVVFVAQKLLVIALGWLTGYVLLLLLERYTNRYAKRRSQIDPQFDRTFLDFLFRTTRVIIWILVAIVILQNLGVQITALIGGLGIGGLAVAFAFQNILSDIFSSISIYFDKPFGVGDYIQVGSDSGTVKKIGMKSTRLQTQRGEELIISNRELTQARVQNFKRLSKRRSVINFGVEYETSPAKLSSIPGLIATAFHGVGKAELERVHLIEFGESSLNYEVVYFFGAKDYTAYRDAHQQIMLRMLDLFNKAKINMAYPVQRMVS